MAFSLINVKASTQRLECWTVIAPGFTKLLIAVLGVTPFANARRKSPSVNTPFKLPCSAIAINP